MLIYQLLLRRDNISSSKIKKTNVTSQFDSVRTFKQIHVIIKKFHTWFLLSVISFLFIYPCIPLWQNYIIYWIFKSLHLPFCVSKFIYYWPHRIWLTCRRVKDHWRRPSGNLVWWTFWSPSLCLVQTCMHAGSLKST